MGKFEFIFDAVEQVRHIYDFEMVCFDAETGEFAVYGGLTIFGTSVDSGSVEMYFSLSSWNEATQQTVKSQFSAINVFDYLDIDQSCIPHWDFENIPELLRIVAENSAKIKRAFSTENREMTFASLSSMEQRKPAAIERKLDKFRSLTGDC